MTAHAVICIHVYIERLPPAEMARWLLEMPLHLLQGVYEDKAMEMFDLDDPEDATAEQLRAAINHYHALAGYRPI